MNKNYKPVLDEKTIYYYVSSSDMIRFISNNKPMEWNKTINYVRNHYICNIDENIAFWDEDILEYPENYNTEQVEWVTAFFKAHPFLKNRMVLVSD